LAAARAVGAQQEDLRGLVLGREDLKGLDDLARADRAGLLDGVGVLVSAFCSGSL